MHCQLYELLLCSVCYYSCFRISLSCSIDLPVIAVSDSLGQVSTIQLEQAGPRLLHQWKAHEFEAWIVSFGSEPHTLFSGGDDCRLCMWDMRAGFMKPRFTSKRYQPV